MPGSPQSSFSRELSGKFLPQAHQEVSALPLDLRGGTGVMKRHHFPLGRVEPRPRLGLLVSG
jgi:hypothetical protein